MSGLVWGFGSITVERRGNAVDAESDRQVELDDAAFRCRPSAREYRFRGPLLAGLGKFHHAINNARKIVAAGIGKPGEQHGETVQIYTGNLLVRRRPAGAG
jgi:hypothetical protein